MRWLPFCGPSVMRLSRARPHKSNHLSPAEGPIHLGEDLRLRRAGGRASVGNPRTNCVADDRHRRPLADRGSPGRTHGNAVTNPRIRVCSTVVLTALPPAPRTRSILPQPVPDNGIAHPRQPSLTTNIRVHCRNLPVLTLCRRDSWLFKSVGAQEIRLPGWEKDVNRCVVAPARSLACSS